MPNSNRSNMGNYRIFIHGGGVFEGTLAEFEKSWFVKPDDYTVEDFIQFIREHCAKNGWEFEVITVH